MQLIPHYTVPTRSYTVSNARSQALSPDESAHHSLSTASAKGHFLYSCKASQFSESLSFFMAKHLTVFEAGLALKTQGSLVKGLIPLRAFVACFTFNFIFNIPASLKEPVFLTSVDATPMYAATMAFTSFVFKLFSSATDL